MKMKGFFSSVVFVLVTMFQPLVGFADAHDPPLPEGARARLGVKFLCPIVFDESQGLWFHANSSRGVIYLWDFAYFPNRNSWIVIDSDFSEALSRPWSYDPAIHGWGSDTGRGKGDIRGIAVSPDGETIAYGDMNGHIEIRHKHPDGIYWLRNDSFSSDGRYWSPRRIRSAGSSELLFPDSSAPGYVPIGWIGKSGDQLATVLGKESREGSGIDRGSYSSVIYTSDRDGSSGAERHEHKIVPNLYLPPHVMNVGFSGLDVASANLTGVIYVDEPGRWRASLKFDTDGGSAAAVSCNSRSQENWDKIRALQLDARVTGLIPLPGEGDVYVPPRDSFSNPANTITLVKLHEPPRWDTGRLIRNETTLTLRGHRGCVWNIQCSADLQYLASAATDGTIRLWSTQSGNEIRTYASDTLHFSNMAFSPDGQMFAVGRWDGQVLLRLRDSYVQSLPYKHAGPVTCVAFNPKLPILASTSMDGTLMVWDLETRRPIKTPLSPPGSPGEGADAPLMSVAFSPDGRRLVVGGWGSIPVGGAPSFSLVGLEWDGSYTLGSGLQLHGGTGYNRRLSLVSPVSTSYNITSVAFSPDGGSLAAGSSDGNVYVWTITPRWTSETWVGRKIVRDSGDWNFGVPRKLTGHWGSVFKVMFTPDAKTLASGSDDGTVLLWDHEPLPGWRPPGTYAPEDVNEDGKIDILDLTVVWANLGKRGANVADVNEDGVVDGKDLTLVLDALQDAAAAAPSMWTLDQDIPLTRAQVAELLAHVQQLNLPNGATEKSIRFLEQLLALLTPQETGLLENYPNPFNPETWIPYQLAVPAEVTVSIYAMDGSLVRTLRLGSQAAGVYQSRDRAAYWDGKNEFGEPAASGIYFYMLTAGEFMATRKMLLRK